MYTNFFISCIYVMALNKFYTVWVLMTWVLFLAWCSSVPEPAQPQPQVIPTPVEEAPVEPVEEPMSSIVDIVVETDAVSILEDIVIEL